MTAERKVRWLCYLALYVIAVALPMFAQQRSFQSIYIYDSSRDAAQDIHEALAEAQRTHKNVWIQVGARDCEPCIAFDRFFEDYKQLFQLRDESYVVVFVNSSKDNKNQEALSPYPATDFYPQIIVLDATGKLLVTEDGRLLQENDEFSFERTAKFLRERAPKTQTPVSASGQRPADKPMSVAADSVDEIEKAITPYVERARATMPEAKKRFLSGLPEDEWFDVTLRLRDSDGKYEVVFVRVRTWQGTKIQGILDSDLQLLKEHHNREAITCDEADVLDWTISHPDGTEEGNFVGKFLDSYHR